jgi:hypothetical protein
MKKSLLTVALVSTAALFSMAADDCSGSNVESCTTDDDCTTEGQACAIAADGADGSGTCVDPACAEDTDCDLQDTGSGSPIADTSDFADGCEAEDYVTIIGFDGNEYCAITPTDEIACEDVAAGSVTATATLKAGGTADVCVLADGTCDLETLTCG